MEFFLLLYKIQIMWRQTSEQLGFHLAWPLIYYCYYSISYLVQSSNTELYFGHFPVEKQPDMMLAPLPLPRRLDQQRRQFMSSS